MPYVIAPPVVISLKPKERKVIRNSLSSYIKTLEKERDECKKELYFKSAKHLHREIKYVYKIIEKMGTK